MKKQIRLNRAISQAGICSRRRADELIQNGQVKINGKVVTKLGIKIDLDKDVIEVQGKKITGNLLEKKKFLYITLYKPIKVVTTLSDPQNRTTIIDILPSHLKGKGLVPIGRLDYFSEGLLLLSNDGDFVFKMSHPKFHLPKVYHVEVRGNIRPNQLLIMKKGMFLKELNIRLAPVKVDIIKKNPGNRYLLKFVLVQGINRQIRRMCKTFNWKVLRLKRISHGPIVLGDLQPGEFRYLSPSEIELCKRQTHKACHLDRP